MRYPDGSYDDCDHLDRGLDGALVNGVDLMHDRERGVHGDLWLSPLTTICDLELGIRASEKLDMLEDEGEIRWRGDQARLEALYKAD